MVIVFIYKVSLNEDNINRFARGMINLITRIEDFDQKLAKAGFSKDQLAQAAGMQPLTLKKKLMDPDCNFSLAEAQYIANLLDMSEAEFLAIFFSS